MKRADAAKSGRLSRILLVLTLRVATILISGCATTESYHTNESTAPSKATVLFDRIPSEDVLVSEVHAVKNGDGLSIYGKVKRTANNCCDTARGHVDIAVLGPDGEIVDRLSVAYSPRNIPKARSRSSRFVARLPYLVPQDVPLRITYHSDNEHASFADPTDNTLAAHNPVKSDDKS